MGGRPPGNRHRTAPWGREGRVLLIGAMAREALSPCPERQPRQLSPGTGPSLISLRRRRQMAQRDSEWLSEARLSTGRLWRLVELILSWAELNLPGVLGA